MANQYIEDLESVEERGNDRRNYFMFHQVMGWDLNLRSLDLHATECTVVWNPACILSETLEQYLSSIQVQDWLQSLVTKYLFF